MLAYIVSAGGPLNGGPFGVALFFLISGFVIPISLVRYNPLAFLVARAWRLVPTYTACFAVSVGAIVIAGAIYARPFPHAWNQILLQTVPGLRMLTGGPFIDPVVWSLEVEILFYGLCASTAHLLRQHSRVVFYLPILVLPVFYWAVAAGWWTVAFYAPYVIFMFIGTAVYYHYRGLLTNFGLAALIGVLLIAAFLPHWRLNGLNFFAICFNYPAALAVFMACYLLKSRFKEFRVLRWLSGISYPLYLVHTILGFLILRILLDLRVNSDVASIAAIAAVCAVAYGIHRSVELPTQALGKRYAQALTQRSGFQFPALHLGLSRPSA